ncbi:hypothetical protein [Sphingobium sp. EP60837]|uniref:hypothetical protein n=1 Tax=Sphingobium sp. EP60837 TaxID=1855519 RepID=UPI0007DD4DDD|nr:hypothetical protein [Sphingobium sp. EP60837]ANI78994.1 hypothetical protein EP837_02599 [Sphingobium sp. EP60837]
MTDEIDQEVREAAADLWRLLGEHPRAESILAGHHDQAQTVQILARMKAAGREQGLREAAEVAATCPVQCATVRDGDDEWHIECRFKDGQKFAAIIVDKDHEDLADWIAAAITALSEKPA